MDHLPGASFSKTWCAAYFQHLSEKQRAELLAEFDFFTEGSGQGLDADQLLQAVKGFWKGPPLKPIQSHQLLVTFDHAQKGNLDYFEYASLNHFTICMQKAFYTEPPFDHKNKKETHNALALAGFPITGRAAKLYVKKFATNTSGKKVLDCFSFLMLASDLASFVRKFVLADSDNDEKISLSEYLVMMADSKTRVQHVFEETKKYDVALVALQLALQASEKELQNAKQTIVECVATVAERDQQIKLLQKHENLLPLPTPARPEGKRSIGHVRQKKNKKIAELRNECSVHQASLSELKTIIHNLGSVTVEAKKLKELENMLAEAKGALRESTRNVKAIEKERDTLRQQLIERDNKIEELQRIPTQTPSIFSAALKPTLQPQLPTPRQQPVQVKPQLPPMRLQPQQPPQHFKKIKLQPQPQQKRQQQQPIYFATKPAPMLPKRKRQSVEEEESEEEESDEEEEEEDEESDGEEEDEEEERGVFGESDSEEEEEEDGRWQVANNKRRRTEMPNKKQEAVVVDLLSD